MALPDGRLTHVTLEPTGEDAKTAGVEEDDTEGTSSEPTYLSHLTRPPVAFGRPAPPAQETVVVRDATIWTGAENGVLEAADLVVRDGKIVAVGADLEAPAGAREIDGTGRHVTAGMIDEHAHIRHPGRRQRG